MTPPSPPLPRRAPAPRWPFPLSQVRDDGGGNEMICDECEQADEAARNPVPKAPQSRGMMVSRWLCGEPNSAGRLVGGVRAHKLMRRPSALWR